VLNEKVAAEFVILSVALPERLLPYHLITNPFGITGYMWAPNVLFLAIIIIILLHNVIAMQCVHQFR
jgi:hypothetical protein